MDKFMKLKSHQEVAEQTMAFRMEEPDSLTFTPGECIEMTLLNPPESDAEGNSRVFSIDDNIRIEEFAGY